MQPCYHQQLFGVTANVHTLKRATVDNLVKSQPKSGRCTLNDIITIKLMSKEATEIINQSLQHEETLIWAGQPKKGLVFEVADIFKTIFMVIFAGFVFFAVRLLSDISLMLAIPVGVLFFSAAFILGIGRFFIDAALRKKTFYGVTDKRIIIISSMYPKKVQSVYFNTQPKIDFLPNMDETSTIDIGSKGYSYLYRIPEANFVHKKIKELISLLPAAS
jgi:hypothetical protein